MPDLIGPRLALGVVDEVGQAARGTGARTPVIVAKAVGDHPVTVGGRPHLGVELTVAEKAPAREHDALGPAAEPGAVESYPVGHPAHRRPTTTWRAAREFVPVGNDRVRRRRPA